MTRKLTLRSKTLLFMTALSLSLLLISLLGLQALRHASEKDNIARINQLMKSTVNIVRQFEIMAERGELSDAESRRLATRLLRENKYHDSEYVYVVDEQLDFIATPHDPQLHGTSFNEFKDADGNSIGRMVENLVGRQTGRIISYNWTSLRDGDVVDLTSVVQKTQRWGWYIGTGISYKEVDARYWDTAKWLVGLSLLITVCLTYALARFGLSLSNALGGEVNDVLAMVRRVSRGKLNSHLSHPVASPDSILGAMNYMQQGLRGVVSGIKQVGDVLQQQGLASESRSNELERLTRTLNDETRMVASAITELTASAQTVVEHAEQSAVSVAEAERQGQAAARLTVEATDTIALLEQQIDSAGNNIQLLDDEVNHIASVLGVIQGIAEQTNLLALNAAIEAARAGEQGRGFAVVADEVRQLASRTQTSTEEIRTMIGKLQAAALDAKNSVTLSIETSEQTVAKSHEVDRALQQVAESLAEIAGMSHQIAHAAKEQLAAGEDTARRIVVISDNAAHTAELSRQAHHATDSINGLTGDLDAEIAKFEV